MMIFSIPSEAFSGGGGLFWIELEGLVDGSGDVNDSGSETRPSVDYLITMKSKPTFRQ